MLEYRPPNAMDESARQLSLTLDSVAKALAAWTVDRHHERDATLPVRYGPGWRRRWVEDVENRIHYLAQALAVRRPAVFNHTVSWSGSAFAARDVAADDLSESLRCLREILETKLPQAAGTTATSYVDGALDLLPRNGELDAADTPSPLGRLTLEYLEAVLDGRRNDAAALIAAAAASGTAIDELYASVLQPAQIEVGRMWHRGEITVADEHFATATAEHVMSVLRSRFVDVPRRGTRVVATAVAGDLHSLGVRMVAEFFEMDGWDAIYLGANTPSDAVAGALVGHSADLLALSATSFLNLRELGDLIEIVRAIPDLDGIRIIVGGVPFNLVPDLHQELGADATAATAAEAVTVANALVAART